jgi:hypothetical protein
VNSPPESDLNVTRCGVDGRKGRRIIKKSSNLAAVSLFEAKKKIQRKRVDSDVTISAYLLFPNPSVGIGPLRSMAKVCLLEGS